MIMFDVMKIGDRTNNDVKEFIVDDASDVDNLPTDAAPGSTCIVISTADVYMLNNQKQWKPL